MSLIEVETLARTFTVRRKVSRFRRTTETVHAVRDISFSVERGEMVGYIGPNGAGKSTTIKMLTGILVPTSGRLSVAGVDPSRDRVALTRRIGVVFGQRTTLWWDLPLRDSFDLLRRIYRVDAARYRGIHRPFADQPPCVADRDRARRHARAVRRAAAARSQAVPGRCRRSSVPRAPAREPG